MTFGMVWITCGMPRNADLKRSGRRRADLFGTRLSDGRLRRCDGEDQNWFRRDQQLDSEYRAAGCHVSTLDDLAPNRMICGIGAWWDPLASNVGIHRKNPLTAMEETVIVMRRLLNMERVTFDGEFIHVKGIELDVVHGRREPRNVPIYVGATGPRCWN